MTRAQGRRRPKTNISLNHQPHHLQHSYLGLKNREKKKLNILICQAHKLALGLPAKTSTEKLLQLGVHNTWEELAGAHRVNQIEQLKLMKPGRATIR